MIELEIPGRGTIQLEHLVCDVNGTLAVDGRLLEGVAKAIARLSDRLTVYLVTANTHGKQALINQQLGLQAHLLTPGQESQQKADFVNSLGAQHVVAVGQGANDAEMLAAAAIGICVLSTGGTAVPTLLAADVVTRDIQSALDLLEKPLRMIATLRK
jgi:P-type E1-E2 ATPase